MQDNGTSSSNTVEKMSTKPSFIIIKLDHSLLRRLSVLTHRRTCDHCVAFHENCFVMPILPDAESIEDVMSAIKAEYRIDVAIKLSTQGVFFPPQLPIEILAKFERIVFRVSPLRKQKFDADGGCTMRQSPHCQASINADAVTAASQSNVVTTVSTTGASSDWETFTSNLENEEDSGTSDMDADGSEDSEGSGESDDGEESVCGDENVSQEELEEEDDSPDYDPAVAQEDVDDDEDSSNGDCSDSEGEQSTVDGTYKENNQDREAEDEENEQIAGGEYTESGRNEKSAEEQGYASETTDLKDPRSEELPDFNFDPEMSLQTSEPVIIIMNEEVTEESPKLQSPMPNASSIEAQQLSSANIAIYDTSKWSLDSDEISAVPPKTNESVSEAGNLSTLDTSFEVDVKLSLGDKPLMTSTPNDLAYTPPNLSMSPDTCQAPVRRPKLKRQLSSDTFHEDEISHSKRTKHSSIIDLGKSLMRSFAENLCDLASSSNSYTSISNLQRRASGPPTPHPKAIVWPARCPNLDDESQNSENWIPVASKTAFDIPPGSCIKFKLRKAGNMEEVALQVESITDEKIIGYSLQEGKDAISYGPKSRTKRMLSFQKDSMEDVFILSRARAFGIDLSNMNFNFD